jgi:DNA-binding NtrC family response regulator
MKGNLLIVDDEPMLLKRLRLNLAYYADQIFTASNGIEALSVLDRENVHCVVCDVNMPKMNGIEVIKKIREFNNPIPFIFYTGHGNHEMMLEVAKYGAYDFFNKPDFDGLEDILPQALIDGMNKNIALSSLEKELSDYQKILKEMEKLND